MKDYKYPRKCTYSVAVYNCTLICHLVLLTMHVDLLYASFSMTVFFLQSVLRQIEQMHYH